MSPDSGAVAAPVIDSGQRTGRPYVQYDVFTSEPLSGNQLAVFTDAAGLDTDTMQRLAREMNFPESTFILPVEWAGTDTRMRIFTPATEMPIAGHPTIGSTFALADLGVIKAGTSRFVFHLNIGPTPVDLEWTAGRLSFAWMTQPNPVFGPIVENRAAAALALGLTVEDLWPDAPVQQVSCGVPFLYVPLRSTAAVDRAVSDAAAFRHLGSAIGTDLPVFLFALAPSSAGDARHDAGLEADTDAGSAVSVYSRMFAPGFGITEDPATGIASGPLGAYLVSHRLVPVAAAPQGGRHGTSVAIVSRQGVAMGRASQIHISIGIADGIIHDVKVGGQAVLVARGEFLV